MKSELTDYQIEHLKSCGIVLDNYTTADILELLPATIVLNSDYKLWICKDIEKWYISYENLNIKLKEYTNAEIIDAAYEMLLYLISKNLI